MQILFKPFKHEEIIHPIPETTDGFERTLPASEAGMMPESYCTEAVPAGTYAIHMRLEALCDIDWLYIFTGRKQLRDILSLKKGDRYERTFY